MYKKKSDNDDSKVIDLAKISPIYALSDDMVDANKKAEKIEKEVNEYLAKKLGERYILIYKGDLETETHICFSPKLNPVEDLMPIVVKLMFCISECYELEPLNVMSAIFNAGYNLLMDERSKVFEENCGKCEMYRDGDCTCDGDCRSCAENNDDN